MITQSLLFFKKKTSLLCLKALKNWIAALKMLKPSSCAIILKETFTNFIDSIKTIFVYFGRLFIIAFPILMIIAILGTFFVKKYNLSDDIITIFCFLPSSLIVLFFLFYLASQNAQNKDRSFIINNFKKIPLLLKNSLKFILIYILLLLLPLAIFTAILGINNTALLTQQILPQLIITACSFLIICILISSSMISTFFSFDGITKPVRKSIKLIVNFFPIFILYSTLMLPLCFSSSPNGFFALFSLLYSMIMISLGSTLYTTIKNKHPELFIP
jgi:hypothetical protein